MISHKWTIEQLDRQTDTGGVITAHWRVNTQDGGYTATAYGTAGFTPDPEDINFKPFDELTEDDVLGWVWASEEFNKDQIETNLASQIANQKNPPVVNGTPW
jgi:hypothetical protein